MWGNSCIAEDQRKDAAYHMSSEITTIKEVYSILRKEVEMATLQSMPASTYQRIAATLEDLKGQGYEGIEAKLRDHVSDLLATSAELLLMLRHQKILNPTDQLFDFSKLTDEEKYILDGRREWEKRMEEVLAATTKGRPKVLESLSSKIRSKQVVVRFLKPMEQFVGVDLAKYGPFEAEDVAVIPLENARSLFERGEAIEVHVQY